LLQRTCFKLGIFSASRYKIHLRGCNTIHHHLRPSANSLCLQRLKNGFSNAFCRCRVLSSDEVSGYNNVSFFPSVRRLTPHGSAAFSYFPPRLTIRSSSRNGISLTLSTISSSTLLKPMTAFPAKMDLFVASVAPTRALDDSPHVRIFHN
jgi:hypothetical protein